MLWIIYNICFPLGFLLLLPRFLVRMIRRGGYAKNFGERFARYKPGTLRALEDGGHIWIHAVSVGEIFVALRFMAAYRKRHPEAKFVVSTTTSTGHRIGEEKIGAPDILIYFPLDFPWVMRRALRIIRPALLVLTECELWPNLIRLAKKRGVPVILINGRISEHSYNGYRKLMVFTRGLLAQVDLFCVQSETEKKRLTSLGASEGRVRVLSSAKYDIEPPTESLIDAAREVLRLAGIEEDALVLLGGSTWAGEESILLDLYRKLRPEYPGLRLVLVPRHVERSPEVEREVVVRGLNPVRRSELVTTQPREPLPQEVLLVDTTGELLSFYACATVIFVGKSLTQHGGQNIIEPAACGKPVVVGPHMENFPVIIQDFLSAGAVVQVSSAEGLESALRDFLASAEKRGEYGERASALVREKAGAARRTVDLIEETVRKTKQG